jgi:hypothetical protein
VSQDTSRRSIVKAGAETAARVNRKPQPLPEWRTHDLRRSGVSTLAQPGFDSIVVDKLLAHHPAKLLGVAAVSQRHDFAREHAAALDAWAAHVAGAAADKVIPMRSASQ